MYVILAGAMVLSLASYSAKAQNGRFSIGAELGMPMGTFGDAANIGFGGSLRYEMPMGDNLGLMLTAGYLTFGGKETTEGVPGFFEFTSKSTTGIIPIQVGAKYYFSEQQEGFYGMVQLGLSLVNSKNEVTVDVLGTKTTTETTSNGSGFSYAPGIGYHLANLDFGLSYQLFSQTVTESTLFGDISATSTGSYLGLRIAYVLGEK